MLEQLEALHERKQDIAFNFEGSHLDKPQRGRIQSIDAQAMTVSLKVEYGQRWFEATIPIGTLNYLEVWQQPEPEVELKLEAATAAA